MTPRRLEAERDYAANQLRGCIVCQAPQLAAVAAYVPQDLRTIGGLTHVWYGVCSRCLALCDVAERAEAAIASEFRGVA